MAGRPTSSGRYSHQIVGSNPIRNLERKRVATLEKPESLTDFGDLSFSSDLRTNKGELLANKSPDEHFSISKRRSTRSPADRPHSTPRMATQAPVPSTATRDRRKPPMLHRKATSRFIVVQIRLTWSSRQGPTSAVTNKGGGLVKIAKIV
ncbi:hypothetical protein BC567DRAFT_208357 [Phyllosticta citribraziliensis]